MVSTYPAQVSTFKVIGVAAKGIQDSADVGQDPDLIPLAGAKVTFTPRLTPPVFKVLGTSPTLRVHQESVFAVTDELGFLKIEDAAETGVVLPWGFDPDISPSGWPWNVLFEPGGNFPPQTFVIDGGPAGTIVDLFGVLPVPADPGTEIPIWVGLKNDVYAARDATLGAAEALRQQIAAGNYQGPPNILTVGTVTTKPAGSIATAEITGTSPAQVLNLGMVTGNTGAKGDQGDPGDLIPFVSGGAWQTATVVLDGFAIPVSIERSLIGNPTLSLSNRSAGSKSGTMDLTLVQDGTGGRIVTWPANVYWPEGLKPQPAPAPGAISRFFLTWNGVRWIGGLAGSSYAT